MNKLPIFCVLYVVAGVAREIHVRADSDTQAWAIVQRMHYAIPTVLVILSLDTLAPDPRVL